MMSFQLLLIGVALIALPILGKAVAAILRLLIQLVTSAFLTGLGLLVLVSMVSHGKLI
jgi:hypothetical protein